MSDDDFGKLIESLPDDRKHGLILRRTSGALVPGCDPVVIFEAEMKNWKFETEKAEGTHVFIMDLRQAKRMHKIIGKMLDKFPDTEEC